MNVFFLLVEIFLYVFAFYILRTKRDLGILYLPVLFFSFMIINPILPLGVFYGTLAFIYFAIFRRNYNLLQHNVFSILLFIYFIILVTRAGDTLKYSLVYFALFFFISLPLINEVYKKYSYEVIIKELTNAALIILILFITNVLCASITGYLPDVLMYGISTGVLYGNIAFAGFNVIAIALFIVLLRILNKSNIFIIAVYVIAFALMMLTLRRSAMLVSIIGVPFAVFLSLGQRAVSRILLFAFFTIIIGAVVYFNSNFASVFRERYEVRNLDEKRLNEEQRFSEYEIIYNDMFVFKDYSPLTGYELFNSSGNYGRGMFVERTLHSDLASIAHSSGLIGVALYILMIFTAFYRSYTASTTTADKAMNIYCFIVFAIYTTTGRFTQVEAMLLLFLVSNLSLSRKDMESETLELEEEEVSVMMKDHRKLEGV